MLRFLILLVALLPAAEADSNADRGEALRQAALAGDLAQLRALLDGGTPVDTKPPRHGQTPLLFAAQRGHVDIVKLLLDRGADVNARESFFLSTPLTAALDDGHRALARMLLERGAKDAGDALISAVEHGDIDLALAALATRRVAPL